MVFMGIEPTLVTLFGAEEAALRSHVRAHPALRRNLRRKLRRLSPIARGKIHRALARPSVETLHAVRSDPEIMGFWPLIIAAAKGAAKFGTQGLAAIAKAAQRKQAKRAQAAKARVAAVKTALTTPPAHTGASPLLLWGVPALVLLAYLASERG